MVKYNKKASLAWGIGLLVVLAGCQPHASHYTLGTGPSAHVKTGPTLPGSVTVNNAAIFEKGKNGLVWELRSPQAAVNTGAEMAELTRVDGTLYENGKAALHVKAPRVMVDRHQHTVMLDEGAEAESLLEPETFHADRMVWNWEQRDGVEAVGHIQFKRGATSITAGRLLADVGLRRARLLDGPVAISPAAGV